MTGLPADMIARARDVKIEDEVERRGIKLRGTVERVGPCPVCGGTDRFGINTRKQLFHCRGCAVGGDVIRLVMHVENIGFREAVERLTDGSWRPSKPRRPIPAADDERGPALGPIKATYDYTDEAGELLYQALRFEPAGRSKQFRQRTGPDQKKWSIEGVRIVPFRLPELLEDLALEHAIFVVEGEKDALTLRGLGVPATTNPMGAGKWREDFNGLFRDADVVVCGDNDNPGRAHVDLVARNLHGVAKRVRILDLAQFWPGIEEGDDISDWIARGDGTVERLYEIVADLPDWTKINGTAVPHILDKVDAEPAVKIEDFVAYMQSHDYVFMPAGDFWPAARIDARLPPVKLFDKSGAPIIDAKTGEQKQIAASAWLAKNAPVEQLTWIPGQQQLVRHRLVGEGGWIDHKNATILNLYRPPRLRAGDPAKAGQWIAHVRRIYPVEADHIIRWLAHRVQRPQEKINHGLVLGGPQGIGKDTLLEPVKRAVGPWNFIEVSPGQMLGRFNGFVKSVVLRISEAKDMGEVDRFKFYDHMKVYLAAPPDVLRVDEKNLREHSVFNVCGVVLTTNHKLDGIYLPADDRRHFVAWSDVTKADFDEAYWKSLWGWYEREGFGHVAAYLAGLDLSGFNPKAPPPQTPAFWDIVDANRSPEDAELADVVDMIGEPAGLTIDRLIASSGSELALWLKERKNRRAIPHRLEKCGYVSVRNDAAADGLWKLDGKRQVIYARCTLSISDRFRAAQALADQSAW